MTSRLQITLAFHYLGCASVRSDGVGVPSRVGALIESLAELVEKVIVVAYDPPAEASLEDGIEYTIEARNVSVHSLGEKGSARDHLRRKRHIADSLAQASERWDVLILQVPHRRMRVVLDATRTERIVPLIVGSTDVMRERSLRRLWAQLPTLLTARWTEHQMRDLLRRTKLALVNSEDLRRRTLRPGLEVRTILLSARRERHAFRSSDRLEGIAPDVLIAGRLTLEKGVIDAVEAFAVIKKDFPDGRLHVAGEGPALIPLLDRAAELGVRDSVVVHGWVSGGDAISALYREMDVLVLPSYARYEGFPYVLWEAMAHSVLVVSTRVGGVDHVLEDEHELLYVPYRDPGMIAAAIGRLARDRALRQRLLSTAFVRAQQSSAEAGAAAMLRAVTDVWPELMQRPA